MRKSTLTWGLLGAVAFAACAAGADAAPSLDPVQVAPHSFKVILENARVRVLSCHSDPGEKVGLHSHPDAVLIALSDYQAKVSAAHGKPQSGVFKRGEARWSPATVHAVENTGKTSMDCIVVELKQASM